MTNSTKPASQDADAVEQLLARAEPRPTPSPEVLAAARAAVKDEWRQTIRRRKRWRYAVAASALVAALVFVSTTWVPPVQPVTLASIDKINGTYSFLRDDGIIEEGLAQTRVLSGETIMTGRDSSLGLRWHSGGSLRLDVNTSIRFVGPERVELLSGRVYFDSGSAGAPPGALVVHTDLGDLRHLGTQYMADVREPDMLRVSVREGTVAIDGRYHNTQVQQGKQLVLHGDRRPVETTLVPYSAEWQWTQSVAPAIHADGKTFYEILQWVSRETGLAFHFASESAEDLANKRLRLKGVDDGDPMTPMKMLRVGAFAAQLAVKQDNGEMLISVRGP